MARQSQGGITLYSAVVPALILLALLIPAYTKSREKARMSTCASNVRQMLVGIQIWQQDHDNRFPGADNVWSDAFFLPQYTACPSFGPGIGYAYNANLADKRLTDPGMPEAQNLVVVADCAADIHLMRTAADIDYRHAGKAMVGYADGHVALLPPVSVGRFGP